MKTVVMLVTVLAVIGSALSVGAQTTVVVAQPPVTGKFAGEVWTWDSARSIVTLYDAGKQYRVQVTPDQIARLQHHSWATVNGTLLGPEPIETVLLPAQPMTSVPNGPASTAEVTGEVTAIDASGIATINSARGPLRVWVADGAQSRFAAGRPVKVIVNVQPVRMVAVSGGGGQASGPTMTAPSSVPGDQAFVVGRVLTANAGMLTVESPRGPVTVWVPDGTNFKAGDFVHIQTVVQGA